MTRTVVKGVTEGAYVELWGSRVEGHVFVRVPPGGASVDVQELLNAARKFRSRRLVSEGPSLAEQHAQKVSAMRKVVERAEHLRDKLENRKGACGLSLEEARTLDRLEHILEPVAAEAVASFELPKEAGVKFTAIAKYGVRGGDRVEFVTLAGDGKVWYKRTDLPGGFFDEQQLREGYDGFALDGLA